MVNSLDKMYLDWFNNFLTVEAFASYYRLDVETANRVINEGRKIHNQGAKTT